MYVFNYIHVVSHTYLSVVKRVAMLVSSSVCESLAEEQIPWAESMASWVTNSSSFKGTSWKSRVTSRTLVA